MTVAFHESKRVKQFRKELINTIPRFPNDRHSLKELESRSLGSLMLNYVTWVSRLIPVRPRKVSVEASLLADPRWPVLADSVCALLEKFQEGKNINPHLSLRVLRNGYTPAASSTDPNCDRWADKDFVLTTMGYHHLHLSHVMEPAGYFKRTDVVLFVEVTREHVHAIGLFDHSVFDPISAHPPKISLERQRLWEIHDHRLSSGMKPGAVYIHNPIATSGHALRHTKLASDYAYLVGFYDPKLDKLDERVEAFESISFEVVRAMKLSWHIEHLDFGLFDKTTSTFYVMKYGPI